MAYAVKYRCEFKDYYNVDIKIDILKEDYTGSVISVRGVPDAFNINYPSDRGNQFNPVRGALASFNVYADSVGQFDEFFDAYETQYQLKAYYNNLLDWTGWVMVGEHQEAMKYPPYEVSFKAYDLGYLKNIKFEKIYHTNDSIIDVLNRILSYTDLSLSIKESINLYEDSISSLTTSSPLNQINVDQGAMWDDDNEQIDCYTALQRELIPFNAFIVQQDGVWNISRIPDLVATHSYRVFNTSGTVTSTGNEDTRVSLASFSQINQPSVMLAGDSWKNLNFKVDLLNTNIIPNGHNIDTDLSPSSFWSVTDAGATATYENRLFGSVATGVYFDCLLLTATSADRGSFTLDKTFYVPSTTKFIFEYEIAFGGGSSATDIRMGITLNVAGTNYSLASSGSWFSGDSVQYFGTQGELDGATVESDAVPGAGTLSIKLYEANWDAYNSANRTYFKTLNLKVIDQFQASFVREDLTKEINAKNLIDPDQIVLYRGDLDYHYDLVHGAYKIASTGAGTDAWTPRNTYGATNNIQQLCAECYQAQHLTTAKRVQSVLRRQGASYLDVITYDDEKYLASNINRDYVNSELQGEWIQIKKGLGGEEVSTWEDYGATFDTLTDNGDGTFSATKNNTSGGVVEVTARTNNIDDESGYFYKVEVFGTGGNYAIFSWDLTWGTASETNVSDGDVFYLKPGSDAELYLSTSVPDSTLLDITVGISVKRYYGV